jgi:hypothetical protein
VSYAYFQRFYVDCFRTLYVLQGGMCGVCRGTGWVLWADHCHVTQDVRGLVCPSCNQRLRYYDAGRPPTQYGEALRRYIEEGPECQCGLRHPPLGEWPWNCNLGKWPVGKRS